jgi:alpha-tubulin suppressor-like RCC1 family protein
MNRSAQARLWCAAILTVVVGSWLQWPGLSAESPAVEPGQQHSLYVAGDSSSLQFGGNQLVVPPTVFPNGSPDFNDVAATALGDGFTLVLRSDGRLFAVGSNDQGQLGVGDNSPRSTPTEITTLPPIVAIAAADHHSLAVDNTGMVWAWGQNDEGQLGTGVTGASINAPVSISTIQDIVDVQAANRYSLALRTDGTVWAWGSNNSLQLGVSGMSASNTPVQVPLPGGATATRIAAGTKTALALMAGGVAGWGSNDSNQLNSSTTPPLPPTTIATGSFRAIAAGNNHTLIVSASGLVQARGSNVMGQLGNGTKNPTTTFVFPEVSDVIAVAAGDYHSLALTSTGLAYGWGANTNRQLGLPPDWVPVKPTPVTNVPPNTRMVYARGNNSAYLNVPGDIGVAVTAPASVTCAQPAPVNVSVTQSAVVNGSPTDVIIVLDSSGSITTSLFSQQRTFFTNFVNRLNIGEQATRVGVVNFSTVAQTRTVLTGNKATILTAISGASYMDGTSCVACAMNRSVDLLESGGRPGSGRSIVFVTDGPSLNAERTQALNVIAQTQAAATVYTILTGVNPNHPDVVEMMASKVAGVDTFYEVPPGSGLPTFAPPQLGLPVQSGPALPFTMQLVVPANFTRTGLSSTAGNTSASGRTITWDVSGNSTVGVYAKLMTTLTPNSIGGDFPIFDSVQIGAAQFEVPSIQVLGCPASVEITPPAVSRAVDETHVGNVTVRDVLGNPMSRNVSVSIVSGPNAGLNFQTAGGFSYSSNSSGTDQLIAVVHNTSLNATGTVTWFVPNVAPTVDAGPDQTIALNGSSSTTFTLSGNVSDDGGPQSLVVGWSQNGNPVGDPSATTSVTRGFGVHTFQLSAADGEFVSTDTVTVTITDPTPPVIEPNQNNNQLPSGWYSDDVLVGFSVSDPESGIASSNGCATQVVTTDGTHTFLCTATNGAGASASATTTIMRDSTPPEIAFASAVVVAEATSTSGASVTFPALTASDATSQVANTSCSSESGSTFPLGDTTVICTAWDIAGNAATASLVVKVVDTTRPVFGPLPDIFQNGTSPTGAVVTFNVTATDLASTVQVACVPPSGYTFPYGTHVVECTAIDSSHNQTVASFSVTVTDPTGPTVSATVAGTLGDNGWYLGDVGVTFSAIDAESAVTTSGCESANVTVDGVVSFACTATSAGGFDTETVTIKRDATPPVLQLPAGVTAIANGQTAVVTFSASADDAQSQLDAFSCTPASGSAFAIGTTHVICTATDQAGNSAAGGFDVVVSDATPPVITANVTGPTGTNGWYTGAVQIDWQVVDPETTPTSCATVTVNTDGANQVFTCEASSGGGSSTASVTISRDASVPVLTLPADRTETAQSVAGAAVTFAPTASDAHSGIASVTCTPASGSMFAIGVTTVSCTATNNAGLANSGTFTITVVDRGEPGKMKGNGKIGAPNNHEMQFDFDILETRRGVEWGDVGIKVKDTRRRGKSDEDRFDARTVDDVRFWNAPDYGPGKNSKTAIDTVVFSGTGRWDGNNNYKYVVTASDRGEPGKGRDTFTIEITAPNGTVVFSGGGTIESGNIQSTRINRPWSWWQP